MLIVSKLSFVLAMLVLVVVALRAVLADFAMGRAVVIDGQTLVVAGKHVRLAGIQPMARDLRCRGTSGTWRCGAARAVALSRLAHDRRVLCRLNTNRTSRAAVCFLGTADVACDLVRQGWALVDGHGAARCRSEQREAILARRGLWRFRGADPANEATPAPR